MKNAKKILALLLTASIVLTTIICGTVTVAAADTDAMVIASTNGYGANDFGDGVLTVTSPYLYSGVYDANSEIPANVIIGNESWGDATAAQVTGNKALDNSISSNVAYKISSTQNEGHTTNVASYVVHDSLWWNIDDAKYILFHVKLPEGATGFRFHGFAGFDTEYNFSITEQNLPYYYIGTNDAVWNYGGLTSNGDGYSDLTFPQGFEGYIAVTKPAELTNGVRLVSLKIRFEKMGGDYGDFYFGGIYATADDIIADGKHITKAKYGADGEEVSLIDYDTNVSWTYHSWSSGSDDSTYGYVNSNHGYGIDKAIKISSSTGKGLYADSVKPIVQIPVGRSLNGVSHIMFYAEVPESASSANYQLRLYAADGGGIEILDNSTGTKTRYAYASTTFEYMGLEDKVWTEGRADSNSQFNASSIKPGFKGYIKLAVDNITNIPADRSNLTLYDLGIGINQYGGNYGDFYFGGFYMISEDANTNIAKFGADGEAKAINFARDNANVAYVTYSSSDLTVDTAPEIANTQLPNDGTSEQGGVVSNGSTVSVEYVDWGVANVSTATMRFGDSVSVGTKRSVIVSSEQNEGYANGIHTWLYDKSTIYFKKNETWTREDIGGEARYLMLYLGTPENDTDTNSIRLTVGTNTFTANADYAGTGGTFAVTGLPYCYLDTDNASWSEWETAGDYGSITLPGGFKGYIVIDLATQIEKYADYRCESLEIRLGEFGPELGSYVYGGYYTLTEFATDNIYLNANRVAWGTWQPEIMASFEGYLTNKRTADVYIHGDVNKDFVVDARDIVALKKQIVNNNDYYYADADLLLDGNINSMDLTTFRKCMLGDIEIGSLLTADFANVVSFEAKVDSIGEASVLSAAAIDEANLLYVSLSSEQKAVVNPNSIEKLDNFNLQLNEIRPVMLGFTCKDSGTAMQSLKIGTDCQVTVPDGYTVSGYGTVSILESAYDEECLLTTETEGATVTTYAAGEVDGTMSAIHNFTDKSQYLKDVITRSYIEYSNGSDTYKVYNNMYTYSDNSKDLYMAASLLEVANAFNVAAFAKVVETVTAV